MVASNLNINTMINNQNVDNEMSDTKWNINAIEFVSSPDRTDKTETEILEDDTPNVLNDVDKIICHEDVVMEDLSEYVDFNVWPLNEGSLEGITGSIDRD